MAARLERITQPPAPNPEIPHYEGGYIALDSINVLSQPRQTFEDIDVLAQDIAIHNVLNPLNVVELNKAQSQKYLNAINSIWETDYKIDDLTPNHNGDETYYILVAGERRLRAFRYIAQHYEEFENEFARRLGQERRVEVRIMRNFESWEAIEVQASENTHMRVPPDDEAMFYDRLFAARKSKDPELTIAKFARRVGRSADAISTALRFAKLPKDIRKYVKQGDITYGAAVEIQRLREGLNLPDEDLTYWVARASVHKRVDDFRKIVSATIAERGSDQTVLGIFTDAQEEDMMRARIRQTAAREFVHGAWGHIRYMDKTRRLLEEGRLRKKDSQYSLRSPLRIFEQHLRQLELIMPFLAELQSEAERKRAQNAIESGRNILSKLIPDTPDDPALPEKAVVFQSHGETEKLL